MSWKPLILFSNLLPGLGVCRASRGRILPGVFMVICGGVGLFIVILINFLQKNDYYKREDKI